MKKKLFIRIDTSPVFPTIILKHHLSKEGDDIVTLEEDDISSSVLSKGKFQDWSLDALTKAGIDPGFVIHTTDVSRTDGYGRMSAGVEAINKELDSLDKSLKTE